MSYRPSRIGETPCLRKLNRSPSTIRNWPISSGKRARFSRPMVSFFTKNDSVPWGLWAAWARHLATQHKTVPTGVTARYPDSGGRSDAAFHLLDLNDKREKRPDDDTLRRRYQPLPPTGDATGSLEAPENVSSHRRSCLDRRGRSQSRCAWWALSRRGQT